MLTALGKEVRRIRLDRGELLKDMADKLKVTSSYLSAIEHGKKAVPSTFVESLASIYLLSQDEINSIKDAIELSRKNIEINVGGSNEQMVQLANAFARKFDSLTQEQVERLSKILKED